MTICCSCVWNEGSRQGRQKATGELVGAAGILGCVLLVICQNAADV